MPPPPFYDDVCGARDTRSPQLLSQLFALPHPLLFWGVRGGGSSECPPISSIISLAYIMPYNFPVV